MTVKHGAVWLHHNGWRWTMWDCSLRLGVSMRSMDNVLRGMALAARIKIMFDNEAKRLPENWIKI